MEEDIINIHSDKPIYNKTHIQIATFFGGPLAIIYVLAENFRQLGYPEKIRRTWVIGLAVFFLFGLLVSLIPLTWKIPVFVFPLIFISVGAAIMQAVQGKDIQNHVEKGGPVYSLWRALAVGSICLLIILSLLFLVLIGSDKGFVPKQSI